VFACFRRTFAVDTWVRVAYIVGVPRVAHTRRHPLCLRGILLEPFYSEDGVQLYNNDMQEVLASLQPRSIDLIFTDPPYGNNQNSGDLNSKIREITTSTRAAWRDGHVSHRGTIANDDRESANNLIEVLLTESARLLAKGAVACVCCAGGGGSPPQFATWSLLMDKLLGFKQAIVWDKATLGLGWHYRRSYEFVLVGQRIKEKTKWYGEHDASNSNIVRIPIGRARPDDHPTPKPPSLVAHFIKLHTQPGDLVLDPFNGGGSTAVACKRLGRRYIGVELERKWCDYTVERLRQESLPFDEPPKRISQEELFIEEEQT